MSEKMIRTIRNGTYEHTTKDGSRISYRGLAGREMSDKDALAAGFLPVGPWQDGERLYERDEELTVIAGYGNALERAQRDYEMEKSRRRTIQAKAELGPAPTLESIIASGGHWSPPAPRVLTDEERAEAAAAAAKRLADFRRFSPEGGGTNEPMAR